MQHLFIAFNFRFGSSLEDKVIGNKRPTYPDSSTGKKGIPLKKYKSCQTSWIWLMDESQIITINSLSSNMTKKALSVRYNRDKKKQKNSRDRDICHWD